MKNINNIIGKKVKGEVAFEYFILFPLTLFVMMAIFYLFIFSLDFLSLNNTANIFANELNIRQTGLHDLTARGSSNVEYSRWTDLSKIKYKNITEIERTLSNDGGGEESMNEVYNNTSRYLNITYDGGRTTHSVEYTGPVNLRGALLGLITKHKEKLGLTGVEIKEIKVSAYKNGVPVTNNYNNIEIAGTSLQIDIIYKCFGLEFRAKGYSSVT